MKKRATVAERDRRFKRLLAEGRLRESDRKSYYAGWRNAGRVLSRPSAGRKLDNAR
jgi:hypothetical protein